MAYLTKDEYEAINGAAPVGFDKQEKLAEHLVNTVCEYYNPLLGLHDLASDLASDDEWRNRQAKGFKQVIADVVDYLAENNFNTIMDVRQSGKMSSFTVGHTSINFSDRTNTGTPTNAFGGIPADDLVLLYQLRLIYRGVGID